MATMAVRVAKDDLQLLDAWVTGDAASARELIGRHTGALVRFFERNSTGPVEDLVQDTLLACVETRDRYRREAGFRGYLFGIARNVLCAHLRARKRQHRDVDLDPGCVQDLGPTPSEVIARKTEEWLLLVALRRLPTKSQALLGLYHWHGLTGPELAGLYGVNEGTVRSRLLRATDALRAVMGRLTETRVGLESTWADFEGWAGSLPQVRGEHDTAGSAA